MKYQTKLSAPRCENCVSYKERMYAKEDSKSADSRCTHYSSLLGKDEKGVVVSFMTLREARAAQSDEKVHGVAPWKANCGPEGRFFENARGRK